MSACSESDRVGKLLRAALTCLVGLSTFAGSAGAATPDPRTRLYDGPDGATCRYFNVGARIPWRHPLGDWRDADGVAQGDKPYAIAQIDPGRPSTVLEWDVSQLVSRWNRKPERAGGLVLGGVKGLPAGAVVFASHEAPDPGFRPRLRVSFADGSNTTLTPLADTWLSCSTVSSLGNGPTLKAGDDGRTLLQFDATQIADRPVTRATLQLAVVRSDQASAIGVYALDPPVMDTQTAEPTGISLRYPSDQGIGRDPDVIFATGFESPFWRFEWSYLSPGSRAETVERDAPRNFEPLLGSALRVAIPKGAHLGLDMGFNFLDEIGSEPDEIFFRYYVRFGDDWIPTADGGKLPGPAGTYGRAGWGGRKASGREGWSLRGSFVRASSHANPLHGRIAIGTYAYHAAGEDFFGDEWDWNLATQLLERNRWYCLEQHVRLNNPTRRDGLLSAWIDDVLAFDKSDVYLRDVPEIRIEKIWMNVYHGGTIKAAEDLHLYIDNVVIARRRIGCLAR